MPRRFALASLTALTAPMLALCVAGSVWAAQDRYGPPPPADTVAMDPAAAIGAPAPTPMRFLNWPSKQTAPAAQIQATPQPIAAQAASPHAAATPWRPGGPAPASIYTAPPTQKLAMNSAAPQPRIAADAALRGPIESTVQPARPRHAVAARTSTPLAPTKPVSTVMATPAAAPAKPLAPPAPSTAAQPDPAASAPPRFYSVQRQYGVTPNAAPLPPQFFADASTGDLAEPPPPPAPRQLSGQAATGSSAAAIRQRQADAAATPDDATTSN